MADETVVRLAKMRQAMAKMRREGRLPEFEVLAEAYAVLKRERMEGAEREHRERVRARRAAREAVRVQEAPSRVWRLPRGFVSPLAAQRAREPLPAPAPRVPAGGHLSPWRGGSPMQERLWRP